MSNEDKKPVPAAARAPAATSEPQGTSATFGKAAAPLESLPGVPVALVRFDRPIQYPGKGSDTQAATRKEHNGTSWVVDYLPAIRSFRIVHRDVARKTEQVGYVPDSHVLSWEPA